MAVISASRRTDIPRWYSRWLAARLREGQAEVTLPYGGKRLVPLKPEDVHTLVLWSKDFSRLLADPWVLGILARYDQIFCHFTVTGLGGSALEPGIPPWEAVMAELPRLIELTGDPRRVVLRFDPIVHWREHGRIRSNLPAAPPIFRECAHLGIEEIKTSFATLYGKILRRGWDFYDPTPPERQKVALELSALAETFGLRLRSCSDPTMEEAGIPPSPCIDGALLTALHPRGLPAPLRKDRGQRKHCRCTESLDIGSYRMHCPGGCLYCYANPLIRTAPNGKRSQGRAKPLPSLGCILGV